MVSECLVVTLIIGMMAIGFFRAKRKNWGFAVLPLIVIPLVTGLVMYVVSDVLKLSYNFTLPMVVIVGSLAGTSLWLGACSMILIKTKKLRIPYMMSTMAFSVALSFLLLIQYQLALGV